MGDGFGIGLLLGALVGAVGYGLCAEQLARLQRRLDRRRAAVVVPGALFAPGPPGQHPLRRGRPRVPAVPLRPRDAWLALGDASLAERLARNNDAQRRARDSFARRLAARGLEVDELQIGER